MKIYELLFFTALILISWPLIHKFFRAVGFIAASYFCKMRYPVSYTKKNGEKITFYLTNVRDVVKFSEDPKLYIEKYKGLHH